CKFEAQGEEWTVQDTNSKNGTSVNGVWLDGDTRRALRPGDRITAGNLLIKYSADTQRGVVVFEDDESSAGSTSTVGTSLKALEEGGARTWAPIQALLRATRQLLQNRPLPELLPLILDLAIEAVGGDRGVLLLIEGEKPVPKAHKGDAFRIPNAVLDRV